MAVLDRYVEEMNRRQADAIVFGTNKLIELHIGGQIRPVSTRPASVEQILQLTTEVVGANFASQLDKGVGVFSYKSPYGEVSLRVVRDGDSFEVRIQPGVASVVSAHPPPELLPSVQATTPVDVPTVPGPGVSAPPEPSPALSVQVAPVARRDAAVPTHIDQLFEQMIDLRASDLHLKAGEPPMVRIDGNIRVIEGRATLTPDALQRLVMEIIPERYRREFLEHNDIDFAYDTRRARMRCNVFRDMIGVGACFRQVPWKIMTAAEINLPPAVLNFCAHDKGLVVVTGPTGSGKSTTLAAMIDSINETREDHLITIEDPIEFVHRKKKCLINQREVGVHTDSFKTALRAALREDPDIVMVGEMRDLETVSIAIETAETGHLVFGTLHTNTAASTIDRLIDQFPSDRHDQIRTMLAESLRGVVAQTLLRRKGGGRVAALEVLVVNMAVSNLIREGKTFQIPTVMQTAKTQGMQTLNDALLDLVKAGVVEPQEAYDRSYDKKEFALLLSRTGIRAGWRELVETNTAMAPVKLG
jgi:twitching motility protein PilT